MDPKAISDSGCHVLMREIDTLKSRPSNVIESNCMKNMANEGYFENNGVFALEKTWLRKEHGSHGHTLNRCSGQGPSGANYKEFDLQRLF